MFFYNKAFSNLSNAKVSFFVRTEISLNLFSVLLFFTYFDLYILGRPSPVRPSPTRPIPTRPIPTRPIPTRPSPTRPSLARSRTARPCPVRPS